MEYFLFLIPFAADVVEEALLPQRRGKKVGGMQTQALGTLTPLAFVAPATAIVLTLFLSWHSLHQAFSLLSACYSPAGLLTL